MDSHRGAGIWTQAVGLLVSLAESGLGYRPTPPDANAEASFSTSCSGLCQAVYLHGLGKQEGCFPTPGFHKESFSLSALPWACPGPLLAGMGQARPSHLEFHLQINWVSRFRARSPILLVDFSKKFITQTGKWGSVYGVCLRDLNIYTVPTTKGDVKGILHLGWDKVKNGLRGLLSCQMLFLWLLNWVRFKNFPRKTSGILAWPTDLREEQENSYFTNCVGSILVFEGLVGMLAKY